MCLAIPGQVVEIVDERRLRSRASTSPASPARSTSRCSMWEGERLAPGDWVLIHVGFAMSRIDEAEAARTLALLREMGDAFEAELAELEASRIA